MKIKDITTSDQNRVPANQWGLSQSGIQDYFEEETVQALTELGVQLQENGLVWTTKETRSLIVHKNEVLKSCGRLEFGPSIIPTMAKVFSKSQNLTGFLEDYLQLLYQMCDLFYEAKNDLEEHMADLDLIGLMFKVYEDPYYGNGSAESTAEWILSWLSEAIREQLSAGRLRSNLSVDLAFTQLQELARAKRCDDSGFADPDVYQWNYRR